MAPVPTLRRLNDRERYWALTFGQLGGVALAGGFLYVAIRISPFGTKPTITIVLLLIACRNLSRSVRHFRSVFSERRSLSLRAC